MVVCVEYGDLLERLSGRLGVGRERLVEVALELGLSVLDLLLKLDGFFEIVANIVCPIGDEGFRTDVAWLILYGRDIDADSYEYKALKRFINSLCQREFPRQYNRITRSGGQ